MAVPAEVRAVPRPVNTIVEDSGRDSAKRYSVRERSGTAYVSGGNPQPHNGKVIGYIIDGKFVPRQQRPAITGPQELSYGGAALFRAVSGDLRDDLMRVMDAKDADTVMAIAALRVIEPRIKMRRYSTFYAKTFVSRFYPGLGLSYGKAEDLFKRLGQDTAMRLRFYQLRWSKVLAEHRVAIDGTLKQNTSSINDLSHFSRKARVKGCKDISVLYAYDIDLKEPICSQVFAGNSIDASSYREFVQTNNIVRGVIIADKGFPPEQIRQELADRPELHFITPIKNSDSRIDQYRMLDWQDVLPNYSRTITFKKQPIDNGRFLYSFRDARRAGAADVKYLDNAREQKNFELKKYVHDQARLGLIVFESDQDLEPLTVYKNYEARWELELVFRHYKSDEELDSTNVQSDFNVLGSEFVNFVATVATCRIMQRMNQSGLLKKYTYGDIIDDLNCAWRKTDAPTDKPLITDDGWVRTFPKLQEILVAMGVAEPDPSQVKKAKAPKTKRPSKEEFVGPKRPRGRPRIRPIEDKPKRPRGRPRKNPVAPVGGL